jgi:hypothetical protein
MKSAILGTRHLKQPVEPKLLLQDTGIKVLQRMAGYQPAAMPVDIPKLPPVAKPIQPIADTIMAIFCGGGTGIRNCNPRAPYLMLAWILVGADNPYRVMNYAARDSFLRPVLAVLLRCAMGERFTDEELQTFVSTSLTVTVERTDEDWLQYADETIAWVVEAMKELNSVGNKATSAVRAVIWSTTRFSVIHASLLIQQQARAWCYLDDEEAWLAIQSLLLDALTNTP